MEELVSTQKQQERERCEGILRASSAGGVALGALNPALAPAKIADDDSLQAEYARMVVSSSGDCHAAHLLDPSAPSRPLGASTGGGPSALERYSSERR